MSELQDDRMAEAAAEQARGHNEGADTLAQSEPDDFPLGEAQACGMDGDCEACQ